MVIKTGTPMFEVLNSHMSGIQNSKILEKLEIKQNEYFVVSAHREENIEPIDQFNKLVEILEHLADRFKLPVIVSTHPRTKARIKKEGVIFNKNVKIIKPLGFKDYNKLQISARTVLSDSGTINEESSILNFPALNIRESFERPEAMEEAAVMMTGFNLDRIIQCLKIVEKQNRGKVEIWHSFLIIMRQMFLRRSCEFCTAILTLFGGTSGRSIKTCLISQSLFMPYIINHETISR